MEEWFTNPQRMCGLPVDGGGNCVISPDQILKDMIEFGWRHQFLLAALKDCKNGSRAPHYWLSGFVIPLHHDVKLTIASLAITLTGMPGGWLWYVPKIEVTENPSRPYRVVMPSQQVLL